jgi:hypothetical protein
LRAKKRADGLITVLQEGVHEVVQLDGFVIEVGSIMGELGEKTFEKLPHPPSDKDGGWGGFYIATFNVYLLDTSAYHLWNDIFPVVYGIFPTQRRHYRPSPKFSQVKNCVHPTEML